MNNMQVLELPSNNQDDNQRLAEMKIDPTFRKLSKNSICFHIWKVEEDRIESIPKSKYGIFYDDCSYIVYAAYTPGTYVNQDTITRELKTSNNIERFIHFWLGNKTSSQKSGNVAYKVMELDSYFGYATTQFRETQENESSRFLSYFKKGIRILCGSLCETTKECRLFQIKGRKSPKCIEQETINWNNFSSIYSMLLKTPTCLFVWIGRSCSLSEKRNSLLIANKMQEEYQLSDLCVVDDGYEQSMSEMYKYEWNRCLSLKLRFVHEPPLISQKPEFSLKLYKCGYTSGKYRIEEYKTDAPEQGDFTNSSAVYIVDGASLGVWIWVGKSAEQMEKTEAMRNARGFVKKKKYPSSTPVVRIIQDHEPTEFIRLFPKWITNDSGNGGIKAMNKFDSMMLAQRPKLAADTQLIDDGSGEKHVFRITDGRFNELRNKKNSVFFSNDCYLIHYITVFSDLNSPNSANCGIRLVVYFWTGSLVSTEIRKKCETSAKNYFENLDKHTLIVKLEQGYETPHFLQIFQGKFIVFNLEKANVAIHSDINNKIPQKYVLRVYGDSTYNSKAFETDSMLVKKSQDRFIIKSSDNNIWIWCGQGSTGDSREVAKSIASVLGEYTLVMESKESEEFIQSIPIQFKQQHQEHTSNTNGSLLKDEYLSNKINMYDRSRISLYVSYHINGGYYKQEILSFDQNDLEPEDIYFLDTGLIIYIWIGVYSNKDERKTCWQAVKQFLRNYPIKRDENTTIAIIQQSGEPNVFIGYFDTWDKKFWNDYITYDQMRKKHSQKLAAINNISSIMPTLNGDGENDFDKYQKYPLSILQQEVDLLPQGVDPIRKEVHLTHDDFVALFNMKFAEFDSLPIWKKQELKKRHKLF